MRNNAKRQVHAHPIHNACSEFRDTKSDSWITNLDVSPHRVLKISDLQIKCATIIEAWFCIFLWRILRQIFGKFER
jgi:hypothetical protein